ARRQASAPCGQTIAAMLIRTTAGRSDAMSPPTGCERPDGGVAAEPLERRSLARMKWLTLVREAGLKPRRYRTPKRARCLGREAERARAAGLKLRATEPRKGRVASAGRRSARVRRG